MMVGDEYSTDVDSLTGAWLQLDSHHSNPDGTPNPLNVAKDTSADRC